MDFNTNTMALDLLNSTHEETMDLFVKLLEICIEIFQAPMNHRAQLQAEHDKVWAVVQLHLSEAEHSRMHREAVQEVMECWDDDNSADDTEQEDMDDESSSMDETD